MSAHRPEPEPEQIVCKAAFAAGAGPGEMEGFASVFTADGVEVVDRMGEVVLPGAFRKTIDEKVRRGGVPFVSYHSGDPKDVLGRVVDAEERSGVADGVQVTGLWFRATLSETPSVQEIRTKALEGYVRGLSFQAAVIDAEYLTRGDRRILGLKELALREVTLVSDQASINSYARLTTVKGAVPFQDLEIVALDWTPRAARDRVLAAGWGWAKTRKAFLLAEGPDPAAWGMQIADVDDRGRLVAIPQAILAAAARLFAEHGPTGGDEAVKAARLHLDKYFSRMGQVSPWAGGQIIIGGPGRFQTATSKATGAGPASPPASEPPPAPPQKAAGPASPPTAEDELARLAVEALALEIDIGRSRYDGQGTLGQGAGGPQPSQHRAG